MKKLLAAILIVAGSFLIGCTVTETAQERNVRLKQVTDLNSRMLVEDWDTFWLYDNNSRLSQWHPYVGR